MRNEYIRGILMGLLMLLSINLIGQHTIGKRELQTNFGFGGNINGLPVYFGIDYGLNSSLSIGLHGGYLLSANIPMSDVDVKINWHLHQLLDLKEEWDIYLGLKTSFLFLLPFSEADYDQMLLANFGARYYWSELWAVNFDMTIGPGGTGTLLGFTRKIVTQK